MTETRPASGQAPVIGVREPWVRPGLLFLAVATVAWVWLYAVAPQSAGELRDQAWVAVAPDAVTPPLARARERLSAAGRALAAGDTAAALARYAEAESEAWSARQSAGAAPSGAAATEVWAGAVLDRAALLLASGARPWYRGDDDTLLREAQSAVSRVRGVPTSPETRRRADELTALIQQQLRPGPLEWLPR
jgi:hypothetical protein